MKKYSLDADVERQVAVAEATVPQFHSMLGKFVDISKLAHPTNKLIFEAALTVAMRGEGCPGEMYCLQELRNLNESGKITHEQVEECRKVLADTTIDDVDALINVVSPQVQKVAYMETMDGLLEQGFSDGDALEIAKSKLADVQTIGKDDAGLTSYSEFKFGDAAWLMDLVNDVVRNPLPTGIHELDIILNGGLEQSGFGEFCAMTGVGKSFFCAQVTAEALVRGKTVLYISTELKPKSVFSRIVKNLMGMSKQEVDENPEEGDRRMKYLVENGLGRYHIVGKKADSIGVDHIKALYKDMAKAGSKPDLIVIDPMDNLIGAKGDKELWSKDKTVASELRYFAESEDIYIWASVQPRKEVKQGDVITTESVSGGMGKTRVCTVLIGGRRTPDDMESGEIHLHVAKRTVKEAIVNETEGIRMDRARGRLCEILRGNPWERGPDWSTQ